MDYELFDEELEHVEFLRSLERLADEIFYKHMLDPNKAEEAWWDIKTFGDQPVFASLLFDLLIEDATN